MTVITWWINGLCCQERVIHTVDPVIDPLRDPIEIIKRSPDRYSPCAVWSEPLFPLTAVGNILTEVWLF